nr:GAF domain-containing protein [Leptospira sp.]
MENLESLLIVARGQKQLLAEVSSHPAVLSGDITTLSRFITESVSELLGLERVGVWLFNEAKDSLINIDLYLKSKGEHSHGAILQQHEFYEEFSYLKTEKYVDASDPYTDPRTKGFVEDYLKPNNITAMLDGVIRIGEELIGAICFEHVGVSHVWEEDEILFCSQLGDQISLAVSCKRKNEITDALREREIQLQELNESLESLVSERTMRLSQSNEELSKTILDLKQAQAKLILSEKMASLGQLIAGIAHEINNPIAAILASTRRASYAVLKRNFYGYFSNPTGYVFLCLFVLLTSMAAFWPHAFFSDNIGSLNQLNKWFVYIMLFFIPAITMSIWAEERRQGLEP